MTDEDNHAERKVQLTGGSTYTVSLPKEWANKQDIEPGCMVDLYSRGKQLVMTRNGCRPEDEQHVATIRAENRDPATIALSVGSSYIAGCEEIRIEELHDSDQRRAVIRAIRGFIGLEVMDEDRKTIVARTMLDTGDLSPEQTLAQLERTTLTMHEEAIEAVITADGETGASVARQDDDVDRLFALISRGFQQSLVDPAVTMGDDDLTPFEYYMAARQLERVADHAEKIATIAGRLDESPQEEIADSLIDLGRRARSLVKHALSGLLEESGDLEAVISDADVLLDDIGVMDEQVYNNQLTDGHLLGLVLDSIARTTQYGVNIAEAGLQARYRSLT